VIHVFFTVAHVISVVVVFGVESLVETVVKERIDVPELEVAVSE